MATSLKQIQSQKQKLAPRQVLNARLLQLNLINLEQTIIEELEQNPTLEQVESDEDQSINLEKDSPIEDMDVSLEDMYSNESNYYLSEQTKEIPIPDQNTFSEKLIEQLQHINLDDSEYEIAEEIVWNINERGYLDTDLILIADRFDKLEAEIDPILHKIQRLEPKGIGARDLKECLMIQLEDKKSSLSYSILDKSFDDFMHKRYDKIKDKFKCTSVELHEVVEEISNLNPRPGEGYRDKFQTVIPDLIVREDGDDWVITTNDSGLPELRINRFYKDQIKSNKFKGEAKKFIKGKIDSAQWFIEAIQQRRVTMVNVMHAIIKFQPEWFNGNMEFLRPLKLQEIADSIKMDISTISRSTRGKFVDTPYGIFELKYFFADSIELSNGSTISTFVIKRALENILHSENKDSPYSDDLLVKKLGQKGYLLARRTIAKYRDQLGYPVARLRKKI
tara:strand:+ start:2455 stop:3801 length:1347 start_codon:yes stop_codon:yes gene_type:complete